MLKRDHESRRPGRLRRRARPRPDADSGQWVIEAVFALVSRARSRDCKSSRSDSDGKTIRVLAGHAGTDANPVPYGGKVTLVGGKKAALLLLQVKGLDLSGLTDNLTVTVTVGPMVAEQQAAVKTLAKLRRFH